MKTKVILRPYQEAIVKGTIEKLGIYDTVCITASTGSGKSIIISELARTYSELGLSVVILTNITELIPQLSNHLNHLNVKHNTIKAGVKNTDDCNVHLIMEQSFHEGKRIELDMKCDILIKDEFHIGIGQKRYEAIVAHLEPSKVIGLTATPLDELGYLIASLEPQQLIEDGNASSLTEVGYLTPLKYFVPKWSEAMDYSEIKSSGNDYNGKEIDEILMKDTHVNMIVGSMNAMNAKAKNTLVYASSIEHGEVINAALLRDGYDSVTVHSKKNDEHNSHSLTRFKSNMSPMCLVSVSKLLIGFDAPNTNLLVICRPSKIKRLIFQCYGRGTRLYPEKEYCEILDLAQCVSTHGFLTDHMEYVSQGNKAKLLESNAKSKLNVGSVLKQDEPIEITREYVLEAIAELHKSSRADMTTKEMMLMFDASNDFSIVVVLSIRIFDAITKTRTKAETGQWISDAWEKAFIEFPHNQDRWIKAYKTRAKSIIQSCMRGEQKKIVSLKYFIEFLVQNQDNHNNWFEPRY